MFSVTGRPLGEMGWWQDFRCRTDDGDGPGVGDDGGDDGDDIIFYVHVMLTVCKRSFSYPANTCLTLWRRPQELQPLPSRVNGAEGCYC